MLLVSPKSSLTLSGQRYQRPTDARDLPWLTPFETPSCSAAHTAAPLRFGSKCNPVVECGRRLLRLSARGRENKRDRQSAPPSPAAAPPPWCLHTRGGCWRLFPA